MFEEVGHLPLQGLNFGGQMLESAVRGIRKGVPQQLTADAGPCFNGVKPKLKKKRGTLAGLFGKIEPEWFEGVQQQSFLDNN